MPKSLNAAEDTSLDNLFNSYNFKPAFITGKKKKRKSSSVDLNKKLLVDTAHLMELLDCGKHTAIAIGHSANACMRLDRKLFWNVQRIQKYIDNMSE